MSRQVSALVLGELGQLLFSFSVPLSASLPCPPSFLSHPPMAGDLGQLQPGFALILSTNPVRLGPSLWFVSWGSRVAEGRGLSPNQEARRQ